MLLYLLLSCFRSQSSKNERKRKKISDSDRLFSRSSVTSHLVREGKIGREGRREGGEEGGRKGGERGEGGEDREREGGRGRGREGGEEGEMEGRGGEGGNRWRREEGIRLIIREREGRED